MYRSIIIASVVLGAVSFSLYFAYNKGYNSGTAHVQDLWTKDKLAQTEQALQKQQQLQQEKQKAEEKYVQERRKAIAAANTTKLELDRLRDELAANSGRKESDSTCTITGTDGATKLERELLGTCAATLVSMAAEADRLETVIVGLQSYVKNVCLAK